MNFKFNDRVKIVTRTPNSEDKEKQLYYDFFGGLIGKIVKIYEADEASKDIRKERIACVEVDKDSLRPDFLKRHKEMEKLEKERWEATLPKDVKANMTAEQKQYRIAYQILVRMSDLTSE